MESIQTKLIFVISSIIIVVILAFLLSSTSRTNNILNDDSQNILTSAADYHANIIDDNFRSTEQSVGTIFNYANKRAETYTAFLEDETERDHYTYDISELGKSIAENTRGAMAVYLRYNPKDYGPISGFWYTINLADNSWQPSIPTDMSLYEEDDLEHVGWYYIPIAAGEPMWMDPYFNANLGVSMISYIIPYYYKGVTVGIIGMDISMDLLKESVSQVSVYETGRAFLIDKEGNVIYHEAYPDGMNYDELPESDQAYFQSVLSLGIDEPKVFQSRDNAQQKLILKELKNGMLLGIYAPLQEINAPQDFLLMQQFIISAVILVFAVLIALVWVKTITQPLKKMTAVAEHYANGDFSEEMSIESEDEIGILSQSLQTMSTSLQKQLRLAASANRAKSDFLANMSHEIRTPINTILGMNEMILQESKEQEILEYSTNIKSAGKTLLSLINSILDFSKIEDGKMEILPVNYATASMINNLVISVWERAKAKGIKFSVSVDDTLPCKLCGDDIRITQIIQNLLTNAVKYTQKGSITFTIREQARDGENIDLFVSVKDTGIGIRKEDLGKLFESFERIEERRNRNIEGTGLGMAIVNRLLPMMGSELHVESEYGVGSEFYFVLRQGIVDSQPIGNYVERLHKSAALSKHLTRLKAPNAKVLVVDDNEMNLKVAKNLLKLNSIEPDLANSGPEAIEKICGKDYDIVFLDHMMPRMDGIETLQTLREQNLLPEKTTVIALTANAIVGAKEFYLAAGFDDYLSKPIEITHMEELLIRYLPDGSYSLVMLTTPESKDASPTDNTPQTEASPDQMPQAAPPADKASVESSGDFIEELTKLGLQASIGLQYAANDRDFYRELLISFASDEAKKAEAIRQDFTEKNYKDYQTRVHALKSTSKTIGANELSAMALEQEMAAKNEDISTIEVKIETLLTTYRQVAETIQSVISGKPLTEAAEEEISMEDYQEQLSAVAKLLKTFEVAEAETRLKKLSRFHCQGVPLSEQLKAILAALDDFDVEHATELLSALLN